MLISAANEPTYTTTVTALSAAIRTSLLSTSVKLTGQSPIGGTFTGSGVMLYAENGTTTLVTAKHNLFMLAGDADPPAWSQNLVTSFQQRVSIYYDANMAYNSQALRSAPISTVTPVTPNTAAPWDYDVMILESTDASLAFFATNNSVYGPTYNAQDQNYLLNANLYLARNNQTFVQTGYGTNRELADNQAKTPMPTAPAGTNTSGQLQYRVTVPAAAALAARFSGSTANPGQYQQYVDTAQFNADPNDSSSEGDSGGGLFVYSASSGTPRLFLIGVTTGADMALAQTLCPTPPALRVNNIVTSLEYCYRNGLLGY